MLQDPEKSGCLSAKDSRVRWEEFTMFVVDVREDHCVSGHSAGEIDVVNDVLVTTSLYHEDFLAEF